MTKRPTTESDAPSRRIRGPAELLQAVPYLLGFHPRLSLVLIGLHGGNLVVTARLDLSDAVRDGVLDSSLRSMCSGGTTEVIAAVYDDTCSAFADDRGRRAPWFGLAPEIEHAVESLSCRVLDVLHVANGRWWSYGCGDGDCCPSEGNPLPSAPSAFAAAATVEGVVPLADRAALADVLTPLPASRRAAVDPLLARAENDACAAVLAGGADRHERAVKRAVFAAARGCAQARWAVPDDGSVARYAVALTSTPLRDSVWLAVDDRRLDGRELWRELARRVPAPYDAPALFLYGWATWRSGNSALAGIAAERALVSDPGYSAADLLLAALSQGVDPRRMPRLRRSA